MSASIVLDRNFNTYTNGDKISGKVYLRTYKPQNIAAVTIKLEGESRTRLLPAPTIQDDRPRPQLEFHKILYQVAQLFPDAGTPVRPDGRANFSVPAGTHEYPFSFKIPFMSECAAEKNMGPAVSMAGMSLEIARAPNQHLRRALPPTLRGFPGEAEIRYYLKATIVRPGFLKENIRVITPFAFCPLESERPTVTGAETFARTRHSLTDMPQGLQGPPGPQAKPGWARKLSSMSRTSLNDPIQSPTTAIAVELRLPDPPILAINRDLPVRILVTAVDPSQYSGLAQSKVSAGSVNAITPPVDLTLASLQLDLAAYTHVRAHGVFRRECEGVLLLSKSNMGVPLNFDSKGCAEIPRELWYGLKIPQHLPPSFEICNLTRTYEFRARVVLEQGNGKSMQANQTTTDLHLPMQLFSGLVPPPQLLAAMEAAQRAAPALPYRQPSRPNLAQLNTQSMPGAYPVSASSPRPLSGTNNHPPRPDRTSPAPPPVYSPSPAPRPGPMQNHSTPAFAAATAAAGGAPSGAGPGTDAAAPPSPWPDAPPTYEQAIADEDRRRAYVPPAAASGADAEDRLLPTDDKRVG